MDKTIREIQQYAAQCEKQFKESMNKTGYKTLFTFYNDLSVAEYTSDENGIKETVQRITKEWLQNIKAITEFVISLNFKMWELYHQGNIRLSQLYARMYHLVFAKVEVTYEHKQEELSYFYNTID